MQKSFEAVFEPFLLLRVDLERSRRLDIEKIWSGEKNASGCVVILKKLIFQFGAEFLLALKNWAASRARARTKHTVTATMVLVGISTRNIQSRKKHQRSISPSLLALLLLAASIASSFKACASWRQDTSCAAATAAAAVTL